MKLPSPETIRKAAPLGCGIGAFVALFMFGVAAWRDHTATASAAAALCLALGVLAALDLETFEGLGIKAKLRTTLSDAERKLESLDKMTKVLAKGAFLTITRSYASVDEQRESAAAMSKALTELGLTRTALDQAKRPFYGFIAGRLWYVFMLVRSLYLSAHVDWLRAQEQRTAIGDPKCDQFRLEHERLNAGPFIGFIDQDAYELPPPHRKVGRRIPYGRRG